MASSRDKLLKQFRELVIQRLQRISGGLLELEAQPSVTAGRTVLRELHGLKGEARMMGFADVSKLVHEMEGLVRCVESKGFALTGGSTDALLVASDAISSLSGATQEQGPPQEVEKLIEWLKHRIAAETGQPLEPTPTAQAPAPAPAAASAPLAAAGSTARQATTAPSTAPSALFPPNAAPAVASAASAPVAPPQEAAAVVPPLGLSSPTAESPPAAAAIAPTPQGPEATAQFSPFAPAPGNAQPASRPEGRKERGGARIGREALEVVTGAVTNLALLARRRELLAASRLKHARELAQLARIAEDLGPAAAELAQRLARAKENAADLHRDQKLIASEEVRELTRLSEEVQAIRMLPLGDVFELYPRMVRDIGRSLGKDIELVTQGGETKADRSVIEALRDPLMHLLRNAVDHGIEAAEERAKAGKPPKGQIEIRASREGERIVLRVRDDGQGISPGNLRRAAVAKGFLSEADAQALNDDAARDLIFLPGFSSKDVATDVSGRGVGLDVVRVNLRELGGDVTLQSEVGKGTSFELRVPVSLTVAPLLFIQAGDQKLCLTATHVVHALKVEHQDVREIAGRPAVRVDDQLLPFVSISSALGTAPERPPNVGELILLVKGQGSTAAVGVDRVLEERVQVILPLKGVLGRFAHLSGATPLADGSLALVLSAAHLISSASGKLHLGATHSPHADNGPKRRRILVADDSPLTRELLTSLLESVGYEVVGAQDGADAFEQLGRESVDMVVTDLEMPRMDGLELTRKLKGHATLRSLPVVIVTTRGSDVDRRRGMDAGADGYIAKGDLVRQDLVDVVARLLG